MYKLTVFSESSLSVLLGPKKIHDKQEFEVVWFGFDYTLGDLYVVSFHRREQMLLSI